MSRRKRRAEIEFLITKLLPRLIDKGVFETIESKEFQSEILSKELHNITKNQAKLLNLAFIKKKENAGRVFIVTISQNLIAAANSVGIEAGPWRVLQVTSDTHDDLEQRQREMAPEDREDQCCFEQESRAAVRPVN